jgi:hypothetical protein
MAWAPASAAVDPVDAVGADVCGGRIHGVPVSGRRRLRRFSVVGGGQDGREEGE